MGEINKILRHNEDIIDVKQADVTQYIHALSMNPPVNFYPLFRDHSKL